MHIFILPVLSFVCSISPTLTKSLSQTEASDALLAKLLQKQLNYEYNEELRQKQYQYNNTGKIQTNFIQNFGIEFSSEESEEDLEAEIPLEFRAPGSKSSSGPSSHLSREPRSNTRRRKRNSSTRSLSPNLQPTIQQTYSSEHEEDFPEIYDDIKEFYKPKLTGKQERYVPERDEWINKHDIIESDKRNAMKMDAFPLACNTGNMKDLSISNKIYNSLNKHAYQQKRIQAKLHEEKDRSTAEHAVDKRTRLILLKLINAGTLEQVNGVISIGKEAVVIHAKGGSVTPLNQNDVLKPVPENIAIKVFKTTMSEFRNRDKYIADDFRFQDRFKKITTKKLAYLWAEKEMRNLERLQKAQIPAPEVVLLRKNILMMRFIGEVSNTGGNSASAALKLSEYLIRPEVDFKTQVRAYTQTVEIMKKMYHEARLVHADLSEYNLLWHENKVWVIDTAQAVEPQHPKAFEFLYRDCLNICKFFGGKLKIKQVPNPRSLFFKVCDIALEGVEIDDEVTYQQFDPSSQENAEFFGKLEELQVRAKDRLRARKGELVGDYDVKFAEEVGCQLQDI